MTDENRGPDDLRKRMVPILKRMEQAAKDPYRTEKKLSDALLSARADIERVVTAHDDLWKLVAEAYQHGLGLVDFIVKNLPKEPNGEKG
jgi:hypothetical protein